MLQSQRKILPAAGGFDFPQLMYYWHVATWFTGHALGRLLYCIKVCVAEGCVCDWIRSVNVLLGALERQLGVSCVPSNITNVKPALT